MALDGSLYSTCKAHCEFNDDLVTKLKTLGFMICPVYNSLYTLQSGNSFIHISMHVDDGMAFSNNKSLLNKFCDNLKAFYKSRWNKNLSPHLGIHITQDRHC